MPATLVPYTNGALRRLDTLVPDLMRSLYPWTDDAPTWKEAQDGARVLALEMPGVAREDIHVMLHDGTLRIDAHRTQPSERQFRYRYRVGHAITMDNIEARLENGILHLRLRPDESRTQRIEIQ